MKVLGERSAGNPHAAFDVAGFGNGRPSYRARSRPYLNGGLARRLVDSTSYTSFEKYTKMCTCKFAEMLFCCRRHVVSGSRRVIFKDHQNIALFLTKRVLHPFLEGVQNKAM